MASTARIKSKAKAALRRLIEQKKEELENLETMFYGFDETGDALIEAILAANGHAKTSKSKQEKTIYEQVADCLRKHGNAGMSSAQIMDETGLTRAGVNGALYTKTGIFESVESPDRKGGRLWKLKK